MNQVAVFSSIFVRYSIILAIVFLVGYLLIRLQRENNHREPDKKIACKYCGAAMLASDIRCPSCGASD